MINRMWNSPTITTWGSFLSRILNIAILLPFILVKFSADELNVWFIIAIIVSLMRLLDMGFSQTFIRVLSYARGGSTIDELSRFSKGNTINFDTVAEIYKTMDYIYIIIFYIVILVLLTIGTFFMQSILIALNNYNEMLFVWIVVIAVSSIFMYGNIYSSFLQGMNHIALLRRWEIFTSLGNIISSIAILYFNGGLAELILIQQFWILFGVIRNKYLVSILEYPKKIFKTNIGLNKDVFNIIWPSAWRSGVGVFMSFGVIQASGLFYAQVGNPIEITSYLFGLRIIQIINEFSRAPFYSKIPLMASLYAKNNFDELLKVSKRGMQLSYWSFFIVFLISLFMGDYILLQIGSNVELPHESLWALFGLAFLIERYGAMHLQLYSLTNIIVWHIANGIAGSIFILLSLILYKYLNVYAFMVAYIIANIIYSLYSASKSYTTYNIKIVKYETQTIIVFALMLLIVIKSLY